MDEGGKVRGYRRQNTRCSSYHLDMNPLDSLLFNDTRRYIVKYRRIDCGPQGNLTHIERTMPL